MGHSGGVFGLDPEQRSTLAAYWWRRAEGEITSWVGFQHVLADLRVEGSPQPILELAERAVADEHRHAMWCRDWALRFGHQGVSELLPRSERPLTFPQASAADNRLIRIALCCFTETVGCFILREVRPLVTEPELRRLNRRHFADELQHSRVGWGHLATLSSGQRERLDRFVPELLHLLPEPCCSGPEQDRPDLLPYGYFTPSLLRRALAAALAEVILPGLEHLGLGSGRQRARACP